MKIARITAAAAMAGALALTGCQAATAPSEGSADETFTVGVTTLFPTGTFAEFVERLNELGPENDIAFEVQDINNDVSKENQVLSAFATKGVDLVVASVANGTGSVAAVRKVADADIPVVCYNTCLAAPDDEEYAAAFVTNDQTALGTSTGDAVAEYIDTELGGTANVAFLTCETYDVCKDRRAGLDDALSDLDVATVASQEGFVVDAATPVATAMLTANPDIDVIIAENEDGIIAAANAVAARGLEDQVAVFGIGINPTVAQLLLDENGVVKFTTSQDAAAWADEVVRVAVAIRDGEDTGDFSHFTASPAYSRDDVDGLQAYIDARS